MRYCTKILLFKAEYNFLKTMVLFKINCMKMKVFFFSLPNRIKYNVDCVFSWYIWAWKYFLPPSTSIVALRRMGLRLRDQAYILYSFGENGIPLIFWFVNTLVSKLLMGNLDLCVFIFKKMHTDANVLLAGIIGTISQQPEIG